MFDVVQGLANLIELARAIRPLLVALGVAVGAFYIAKAGHVMFKAGGNSGSFGGQDDAPFGEVAMNLFVGSCLLAFSRSLSNTAELLGGAGTEVRSALAYAAPQVAGGGVWGLAIDAALTWLAAIGAIGVFRGFLLFQKLGSGSNNQGSDPFWAAIWHILGGGIAINVGMGSF